MSAAELVLDFVCGVILGSGIGIGGMARQSSTVGFFGAPLHFVNEQKAVPFNPALGVVFASALATHTIFYLLTTSLFKRAIITRYNFVHRNTSSVDFNLVLGSILFGIGWAFGGFCPGPSVVNLTSFGALIFSSFMFVGMLLAKKYKDISNLVNNKSRDEKYYKPEPSPFMISEVAVLFLISIPFFLYLSPPTMASYNTLTFPDLNLPYGIASNQIIGGFLIGSAISLYLAMSGNVLGISGRISGIYSSSNAQDVVKRLMFIFGLITSGYLLSAYYPSAFSETLPQRANWYYAVGGLIVGFGTSLANGCTSGHGICGVTRLSVRSLTATALFMAANMAATSFILTSL